MHKRHLAQYRQYFVAFLLSALTIWLQLQSENYQQEQTDHQVTVAPVLIADCFVLGSENRLKPDPLASSVGGEICWLSQSIVRSAELCKPATDLLETVVDSGVAS